MRYVGSSGPKRARVAIVGEAPGPQEEASGRPFDGPSGWLLDGMLREVGLLRSETFVTNVIRFRPPRNDIEEFVKFSKRAPGPGWIELRGAWVQPFVPEHVATLEKELLTCKPNIVIALGNLALWALTEKRGIVTWRGSELWSPLRFKVIPTIHPAAILREMEWKRTVVTDLRRAARESAYPELIQPNHEFIVRPSFKVALAGINDAMFFEPAVIDIETRRGHIACIALSTEPTRAICIPFINDNWQSYWSLEEEQEIILALRQITKVIGQNLAYDLQYTSRYWGWLPRISFDTMVGFHALFPIGGKEEKEQKTRQKQAEAKRLDYLASLFCEHYTYWKEEGETDPGEQLWTYNCKDAVYTFEVFMQLRKLTEQQGMREQVEFQHEVARRILRVMLRGVNWDSPLARQYSIELEGEMDKRAGFLERVFGYKVNPRSTPQLRELFYNVLRIKPVLDRTTARPTLKEEALKKIAEREPLMIPVVKAIEEFRSLGTVKSTFVDAEPDHDRRMRTSYNTAGTETFRFSSSVTAFGTGMNLQNVPTEEDAGLYPNIRRLIKPDPGYVLMEWDLSQADLRVVAWEADDANLKRMLHDGVDIHAVNAGELGMTRQEGKVWTHATDYGLSPRSAARKFGMTVRQTEYLQRRYFEIYPGIPEWHKRVWSSLESHHAVWNIYGFRRFYFGRITPDLLPHALAWIPQSSVALTINKAWIAVDQGMPRVQILLQTHDSFTAQVEKRYLKTSIPKIASLSQIVLPYPDPLIIPIKCKVSEVSWGDVQ